MTGRAWLVVVLVSALAIAGCAGRSAAPAPVPETHASTPPPSPSDAPTVAATATPTGAVTASPSAVASLSGDLGPEGREWLLALLDAGDGSRAVSSSVHATLTLMDGIASGDSGCNTFQGPYTLDGATMTFGILTITALGCAPSGATLEASYLSALRAVRRSGAWSDGMGLYSAADAPLLGFLPASPGGLEGSWTVSVYQDLRGALVPAIAGAAPTLVLGGDGTVSGSDGCIDYAGAYQLSGPRIGISGLSGTRTSCATAELATQEEGFLAALLGSTRWSATTTEVTLRGADGFVTLALTRTGN